jgi:hypothetical protein
MTKAIVARADTLARRANAIARLAKALTGRADAIATLAKALTGRANAIARAAKALTGRADAIARLAKALTGRANAIARLAKALTGRANAIARLAKALTGRANAIARAAKALTGRADAIATLANATPRHHELFAAKLGHGGLDSLSRRTRHDTRARLAMLEELMSVETEMNDPGPETEDERREALGRRIPFDGLVEVGGALGPAFEAQAVDVSKDGMHLRTAYLPEVGQPLTCRFDVSGHEVLASGDVVWRHEEGRGGEFAVRFGDLDAESKDALARIVDPEPTCAPKDPGARVRLHIEGLGSPMRARVKDAAPTELTVGSELGFLQVGKELELEDAETGGKRPARIDKVEVEIDPVTKIPQLVVTLRYDSASSPSLERAANPGPLPKAAAAPALRADGTPEPSVIDDEAAEDDESVAGMPASMKSAFARGAAQITPAMTKLAKRAMVTFALLAARARKTDGAGAPARRMTAPPPGGGLHASGRRVVRSDPTLELVEQPEGLLHGKRGMIAAAAVACAVVLMFFALRKPSSTQATLPPGIESVPPQGSLPPSIPAVTAAAGDPALAGQPPPIPPSDRDNLPSMGGDTDHGAGHQKPVHVAPFGNGAVAHGNLLHIKMDGSIDKIEGASTPTGFTVVIPNRRSLEAAAPLAARDGRIASMRVTNEPNGAELAVTFKDGVPNYQVRAKGDTLEIILATAGHVLENDSPRPLLKPVANKKRQSHDKH